MSKQTVVQPIERLLVKAKTIAVMTDQSVSQVYKLMSDGTYPTVRHGRSVRVPLDKLKRLLLDGPEGVGGQE